MKSIIIACLATLSFSAFSQNLLPTMLINERTGEAIGVECLKEEDGECTLFQYWAADSVDSAYKQITGPISKTKIERVLKINKNNSNNPSNIFDSKRLFVLSESSGVGFSLLDDGVMYSEEPGGIAVLITKEMYTQGKYQSTAGYALQATGATVAMVPVTLLGMVGTGVFLAADVAILPVRIAAKLVRGNKLVWGGLRRDLKAALRIQESVLNGEENIRLESNTWKKIYDGITGLSSVPGYRQD